MEEGMFSNSFCPFCSLEMSVMAGIMATLLEDKDYLLGFGGTRNREEIDSIQATLELLLHLRLTHLQLFLCERETDIYLI